jgi:hypothetical protein
MEKDMDQRHPSINTKTPEPAIPLQKEKTEHKEHKQTSATTPLLQDALEQEEPVPPEEYKRPDEFVQRHPHPAACIRFMNMSFDRCLLVPTLGVALDVDHDWISRDTQLTIAVSSLTIFATANLARAANKVITSHFNHREALIESGIATRATVENMHSYFWRNVGLVSSFCTVGSITASFMSFGSSQLVEGTLLAGLSLTTYGVTTFSKRKEGENNYRLLTMKEPSEVGESAAQSKINVIGGAPTAGGVMWILISLAMKITNKEMPNSNDFILPATIALIGLITLATNGMIRGNDLTEAGIQKKLPKGVSIHNNKATFFGSPTACGIELRRDLKNLSLMAIDTVIFAVTATALKLGQETPAKFSPFFFAALTLITSVYFTSKRYAADSDLITEQLKTARPGSNRV